MKLRKCFALILFIFGCTSKQYLIQAKEENGPILFYEDTEWEDMDPIFEPDVPKNFCKEPPIPSKGDMICGKLVKAPENYVCKVYCHPGYEFPNKAKQGKLICNLKIGEWMPKDKFPNCEEEIICNPTCKNGGTCKAKNVCVCPPRYTGRRCQEDKCKDPPSPSNGKMSCTNCTGQPDRYVCQAECQSGFLFADKEEKKSHYCDLKTGEWVPKFEFPECERVCAPTCQNEGTCIEGNVCICTSHFGGDRCEKDICKKPPTPENGKMWCSKLVKSPNSYKCTAECQAEYQFPNQEKTESHVCNFTTGVWTPHHEFADCELICSPICQNGGKCAKGNTCICPQDFDGDRCENANCNPPCQNGGKCTKGNICNCVAQFRGKRCEHDKCSEPPPPLNGKLTCKTHGPSSDRFLCQAECEPGYKFPNGEKTGNHLCDLSTGEWKPKHEFLDCEPICDPPCQNGGLCIEDNICICGFQFSGERCQHGVCKDPPPPLNGNLTCVNLLSSHDRYMCTAECHSNYYFPSKGKKERHFCDLNSGIWTPNYEFQDCEPICNPSCQNGGQCKDGNLCICTAEFEGYRCENGVCKDPPPPLNGNLTCAKLLSSRDRYMCTAECHSNYYFPSKGKRERHLCDLNSGIWTPKYEFPDCESTCKDPPPPLNGNLTCGNLLSSRDRYMCTGECPSNYYFPSKEKKERHFCDLKSGMWTPTHQFPDCGQICVPPCLNGGKCAEENTCICPPEFKGVRCQLESAVPACVPGWTEYFNTDHPDYSDIGDDETLDRIKALHNFCVGGTIKDITCKVVVGDTLVGYEELDLRGLKCSKTFGFECNKYIRRKKCEDFAVRFFCECGGFERPTSRSLQMCPEILGSLQNSCPKSCPRGFACNGTACVPSDDCPCFKRGIIFKQSSIKVITEDCQRCRCTIGGHSRCEAIKCPDCLPNERSEMDSNCRCVCVGCPAGTVLCPTNGECLKEEMLCAGVGCPNIEIECSPAPTEVTVPSTKEGRNPLFCSTDNKSDTSTCEMLGNVFETFDGFSYQYDICNHVLMKESISELYSVTVHKVCSSRNLYFCSRHLDIKVDGVDIKLGPGMEVVTVKNTRVPVASLWLVSKRFPDFELRKIGNTLVFRSFKYNFDVTWDKLKDARITASRCLINNIVGLCGSYNELSQDDLRMPNGNLASGNLEFGDSWVIGSLKKCRLPEYPFETERKASEICNKLREDPFNSSCSGYVKMKNRVDACVAFMRDCIQRAVKYRRTASNEVMYDLPRVDNCKCQAYESFVEACQITNKVPVREWRMLHDCSPTCPEGMEWQDCGPGCELTCDNYRQRSKICSSTCVPGCYCPPGLIRHQDECVKPKVCQDCVCRAYGDPNYITFDGRYYEFQGNCTYILAQHQTSKDAVLNFRILATNTECAEEPHTSCIQGLEILWNGNTIEKQKNKPIFVNRKPLRAEDTPFDEEGISIIYVPNKSTLVHIKEINLSVRYFDEMHGLTIELPSFFYYNETEGLCGVCNFIQSDDLYHSDGYVTNDIKDFAYSWLEERETRKNCELPQVIAPEPLTGICNFTVSPCEIILDPLPYTKSCRNDVRYSQISEISKCRSMFQYAQHCCERGVKMDEWLKLNGCEIFCSEGMVFECTSACPETCENYKTYGKDDCHLTPLYTCTCPEGKVLKLGKCVKAINCEVCDSQGHSVGDVWHEGPCKTCECLPDTSIRCTLQQCPEPPLCDMQERLLKLNQGDNTCCESYKCVPKSVRACPEPQLEVCPPGKAYVKYNTVRCPVYECECFPELCPPTVVPFLDDGENFTLVTTDCCPEVKPICNPNLCPHTPTCSPGFKLSTQKGRCCNKYNCVPVKNVCVYQHKYNTVNGVQVDLSLEDYYDMEYEPGSSWEDGQCRKCSCSEINGQFIYSCLVQICPNHHNDSESKKYITEVPIPGSCCPKYVRNACFDQGVKYEIGAVWTLPESNSCRKSYRCIRDLNGEAVKEVTTVCDKRCGEESVKADSNICSERCKAPNDTCSAVDVPLNESKGFFGYVDEGRGLCSSKQPIYGLKKCSGQCTASSPYSVLLGHFHGVSNCCSPRETQPRTIILECENGSKVLKKYIQPITCHCTSCLESSSLQSDAG